MTRSIPIALQGHLDRGVTTVCSIIRIDPVTPGYASFGAALLSHDLVYDDGGGELVYSAVIGMEPASLVTNLGGDVDTTEVTGLIPQYPAFDLPITEAGIAAGAYDGAEYTMMLVNYEDLSMGHVVLPNGHGTLGKFRTKDGISFTEELTGIVKQLKQSIVKQDMILCRSTFCSQRGDEREWCGVEEEPLWHTYGVTADSLEPNRQFTAAAMLQAPGYFRGGAVKWLTGLNVGRTNEVDTNAAGVVDLQFEADLPVGIGDQFKIRIGCNKQARDAFGGCKSPLRHGAQWARRFRGEPDINPGGDIVTPGSGVAAGSGGQVQVDYDSAPAE